MVTKFPTGVIKTDPFGHQQGGGQNLQQDMALANVQESNRVLSFGVTGRLSDSGGTAQINVYNAVKAFVDVDVATGTLGPTKATLDASLALVNDGISAVLTDANSILAVFGDSGVVINTGGTPASPIAAITDAGALTMTGPTAVNMNVIRTEIDAAMHTAAALVNKIARRVRVRGVDIQVNPMTQPPPDAYGAGSGDTQSSTAGSSVAFATDSPFSDPVVAITEDSGAHAATGVTKTALDAALDTWRDNVETLAIRLAIITDAIIALTDNSGGASPSDRTVVLVTPDFVNNFPADVADVSTDLADETDTDASLVEVRDAIQELGLKAVDLSAAIGAGQFVYDGGGSGETGTIAVIDDSITAAATGSQKIELDAWVIEVDQALDMVAVLANKLAVETGTRGVTRAVGALGTTSSGNTDGNPVNRDITDIFATDGELTPFPGATIPVTGGSAADPGQLATDVSAALTRAAANVALLALSLNESRTAFAGPLVQII